MKICLVLLSGLPGAGKTTLVQTIQKLSEEKSSNSQLCGAIEGIFELDAFMSSSEITNNNAAESGNNVTNFTPENWRKARDAVREATSQCLSQWLLSAEKENTRNNNSNNENAMMTMTSLMTRRGSVRFVFLVDTLPYRSMRASYWKLCRDLNRQHLQEYFGKDGCHTHFSDADHFIGIVEVRLDTPLDICLQRNERRVGTPQYIPPHVIKGMSESFDDDVVANNSIISRVKDNPWVIIIPPQLTTLWPMIRIEDMKKISYSSSLSPVELANKLLERLISLELERELEDQIKHVLKNEVKGRELGKFSLSKETKCEVGMLPGRGDWLHQIDLQMRAMVQRHMEELKRTDTMRSGIGKLVSKCRETQYAQAKKLLESQQFNDKPFGACRDALREDLLHEFQRKLSDL